MVDSLRATRAAPAADILRTTDVLLEIAVLIPCYNEEVALPEVIRGFRRSLPGATIYAYDNNSTDGTARVIAASGVVGGHEGRQGKGHVVRRMFADVEADIYVLVDGDNTYDPDAAPAMVEALASRRLDMVTGVRRALLSAAYRPGHALGNKLLTGLVGWFFGDEVSDILSGYRVFSRRFVKSYPALSSGFETETEFTVHALELRMPVGEVATDYRERPAGSTSKLRTFRDGFVILTTIVQLVKEERPLQLFSLACLVLLLLGLGLGGPVVSEFLETQKVLRLPTAVLATGLVVLSFLSLSVGMILDSVSRGRKEIKRLAYLSLRPPGTTERQMWGAVERRPRDGQG